VQEVLQANETQSQILANIWEGEVHVGEILSKVRGGDGTLKTDQLQMRIERITMYRREVNTLPCNYGGEIVLSHPSAVSISVGDTLNF